MAKEFLDSKESGRDAKALINLHNNKVGRVVSAHNMYINKTAQQLLSNFCLL